jgi:hypothetical protein
VGLSGGKPSNNQYPGKLWVDQNHLGKTRHCRLTPAPVTPSSMPQAVVPATVNQAPIELTVRKPLALQQHYVPSGEPLVTSNHLDQVNKEKTTHVRQALNGIKKRKKAVAATPAENGVSALSAELQNEINIGMNLVIPTLPDVLQTPVNDPTMPKRRCLAAVSTPKVTTPMSVTTGPFKTKCQGCIHDDLLELKVLEPVHIKHYLKQAGFLALAASAQATAHTQSATFTALHQKRIFITVMRLTRDSTPQMTIPTKQVWNVA